ncbi:MAG: oxidoreductase [Marmoricola sp.]|jgi:glyoxylate/hydroxypyruvate reductase A|nr:oxidoreductase [Marmoricola sp.]
MTQILIASYLEPECVDQIRAAATDIDVAYVPELLPRPRYRCDHIGSALELTDADSRRWSDLLGSAEVMFDFDWHQPALMATRCPELRWVQATSAGIGDVVEGSKLGETPVMITTAAGVHPGPLTEFVIGGLLHLVRDFPRLERDKAARRWERFAGEELAGRSALVIGTGSVGRRVGLGLHHLGVSVTGIGRRYRPELPEGFSSVVAASDLDATLPTTDLLVICCPLTEQTRGMIGEKQLALMPEGAVVTNIGRGPVIDEDALLASLQSGHLRGAVLDVFTREPLPEDSAFWTLPNVVVSPHSASTVSGENARLTELFIENLLRYRAGEPLINRYESAHGY